MLLDGVLTREEKRLIIRLSSCLKLEPHQPAEVYQAILDGVKTEDGDVLTAEEQHEVYKTVFEVAIINASLSKDEFRVMAHLRDLFAIDDDEHNLVESELRDMVKERFEDPNMVEKTLNTLRDSVRVVTTLFDNVRKRTTVKRDEGNFTGRLLGWFSSFPKRRNKRLAMLREAYTCAFQG